MRFTKGGKQYVGSAIGKGGIWARWCSYAKNGHGGNKELKQLLATKGATHAQHFQYSLLEICDVDASDETVAARESHWKNALGTRGFGLNGN